MPSVAKALHIYLLKRFFDSIARHIDAGAGRRRLPDEDTAADAAAI